MAEPTILDVAIIGGGPSGTYCAWRLAKDTTKTIEAFEYSDRIGGRLWTLDLGKNEAWGMPGVHAELGGMRYEWTNQPIVTYLVEKEFAEEIPFEVFPMGTSDKGSSEQIVFVRNKLLRNKDMKDPSKVPYGLDNNETGLTGPEIEEMAKKTHLPMMHMTIPDKPNNVYANHWASQKVFGSKLMEHGKWNLFQKIVSGEALTFMKDTSGYNSSRNSNGNAAFSLFPKPFMTWNADFSEIHFNKATGTDPTPIEGPYRAPVKGMQEIPLTLKKKAEDCRKDNKVKFNMQHKCVRIEKEGENYKLTFKKMVLHKARNWHWEESDEPDVVRYAKQVILAMPRRSIELIDMCTLTNDRFDYLLGTAAKSPAFKLMMGFEFPWWRASGVELGRSVTDLPIRQVYYFKTVDNKPMNKRSLFMASYNDSTTVSFWKGLSPYNEKDNDFVKFENDDKLPKNDNAKVEFQEPRPTRLMWINALHQVRRMHGLAALPLPYMGAYQDWSADPYGAGYHFWKAGVNSWDISCEMLKPLKEEKVFVTGSCYSEVQGWTEGALEASERLLTLHFGLKPLIPQLNTANGSYPWTKQSAWTA